MSKRYLLNVIAKLSDEIARDATKGLMSVERSQCILKIKRLCDYTMNDGKCARSSLALRTFETLYPIKSDAETMDAGTRLAAAKVSATIEFLQTFLLIIDDIMDGGTQRRSKPCWHTLVGLSAINDALFLDNAIDLIVRKAIPQHPRLHSILQTISQTKQKTVIGQMLDCETSSIEHFGWERYRKLVELKTSHYTYYLPFSLGAALADFDRNRPEIWQISMKLGYLFQVQDDYLGCFGDPNVMGKDNSDISEGKCTWLACTLLDQIRSDVQQSDTFKRHFGKPEPAHVLHIREMFEKADIPKRFDAFQQKSAAEIHKEIKEFPVAQLKPLLGETLDQILNRKK